MSDGAELKRGTIRQRAGQGGEGWEGGRCCSLSWGGQGRPPGEGGVCAETEVSQACPTCDPQVSCSPGWL